MGRLNIPMQAIPGAGLPAFFVALADYAREHERRNQPPVRVTLRTKKPVTLSPENPGQLEAHARFYLARAFSNPESPHAERWAWLANWYHQRALGKLTPARRSLQVKRNDLAAGDVISAGFFLSDDHMLQEIVEIESDGRALVRSIATGELSKKTFRPDSGHWGYSVVMGPKVEAIARKVPGVRTGVHPQYESILRWYGRQAAAPQTPEKEILIRDWDVSPGDIIQRRGNQTRPLLVLSMNWPRAYVRYQDGQKEEAVERIENVNALWTLIGGPKLDAIRKDISLIKFNPGPNNWLWVGKAKVLAGD